MKLKIDEIIRTNRKTIALVITAEAKLVVRAPFSTPLSYLENLVEKKKNWILAKQRAASLRKAVPAEKQYVRGELFLFLGENYQLDFQTNTSGILLRGGRLVLPEQSTKNAEQIIKEWYRRQARKVLVARAGHYSLKTGITYPSLKITGARGRWGSCGPRGTLNFTWRLIMAPLPVVDYVVIHELSHIKQHNHSQKFWQAVEIIMPDYRKQLDWLKRNQYLLDLFR